MVLVGCHIGTTKGFTSTVTYAKQIGCEIYQMFLGSPKSSNTKRKNIKDLHEIRDKSIEYDIKIVIHAAYVLNFCHPEDVAIHTNAVDSLVKNVLDAHELNSLGVVVHMGKNIKGLKQSHEVALDNYVAGIRNVINQTSHTDQKILFETGASVGTEICSSIEGLAELYNKFTNEEKTRIGFCVDTCHIFASGYDIRTYEGVVSFHKKFKKLIGWDKVVCVHFNDSLGKCDSHVDRHGDIGRGEIGIKGLNKFAKLCWTTNVPMVLETKCFYYNDENVIEKDDKKQGECTRFTHEDQIKIMKGWNEHWNKK